MKLKFKILLFTLLSFTYLDSQATLATPTCRNPGVVKKFHRLNGYPYGRRGYIVDHICPLSVGGLDILINLQYQTVEDGYLKDKIERTPQGIKMFCTPLNSLPSRSVFNCN